MAQQSADTVAPEAASSVTSAFTGLSDDALAALEARASGVPVSADNWMIAAADPWAVQAGAAAP